jgi:hypothetical protein
MRAVNAAVFRYTCQFFAIARRSPEAARATRAFQDCLMQAHKSD